MNETNQSIALLLEKHYVTEELYFFTYVTSILGEVEEESNLFVDQTNTSHPSILDPDFLYSDYKYGYVYPIELNNIIDPNGKSLERNESIEVYDDIYRNCILFVYAEEEKEPILISLQKESLMKAGTNQSKKTDSKEKQDFVSTLNDIKTSIEEGENISTEELSNIEKSISSLVSELKSGISKDMYEEYTEAFTEEFARLIRQVLDGDFSTEELYGLKEILENYQENVESTIDSISLQIETVENEKSEQLSSKKKEEPQTTRKKDRLDIKKIHNEIAKTLIGQDEPTKRLLIEIAKMQTPGNEKKGILLTGGSGVGKTLLMSLLAENIDRPFLTIDSTQLTIPGYKGADIEEFLWRLYEKCGRDVKKAEQAIIYFDEIDKKGSEKKSDVSGQGVLNLLLKFLDGTTYNATPNTQSSTTSTVPIRTNDMIITAGGAFLDVYQNREKLKPGFCRQENEAISKLPDTEEFIKKGMVTKEFIGRFPVIIHLNDLEIKELKRVLVESTKSPLKEEERNFKELGIELKTTDGYREAIAKKAYKKGTGARGLKFAVADTTWKPYDEVYENPEEYEAVIIDEKTVENNDVYQLIKRNTHKNNTKSE